MHFRVQSGNTTDDRSHRATWDFLCKLTGRPDFLDVADCKLATVENMTYIHKNGGRFASVLPRTRGEDGAFRFKAARGEVRPATPVRPPRRGRENRSMCSRPAHRRRRPPKGTAWCGTTVARKAELDAAARLSAWSVRWNAWGELGAKLASPRTRYREKAKASAAVEAILQECAGVGSRSRGGHRADHEELPTEDAGTTREPDAVR